MLATYWFVPERVTKRICTAPAPDESAPETADVIVTSSTASRRGTTREKKPSVDCRLLPMLMPSSEMLIVFCGRPLMVDWRALVVEPIVSTPGRSVRKFSALRSLRGSD
jgi:hypothetical protein